MHIAIHNINEKKKHIKWCTIKKKKKQYVMFILVMNKAIITLIKKLKIGTHNFRRFSHMSCLF